ncbi:hypothetical protein Lsha_2372 [Legionella shakespearei DSM 23087]|uniref:Uncharacterized protein n=1 Tax=Legionella shakespearei DSM 23087 TaxID=1122169 RepID=A0A0W0YL42_9GAMM|nr:hypothetical protein Lsha_2372 [Legionella shakespearei DSM 23087]
MLNALRYSGATSPRIHVVLSASFCAKDLQILVLCRAQDDVDRTTTKRCRTLTLLHENLDYAIAASRLRLKKRYTTASASTPLRE